MLMAFAFSTTVWCSQQRVSVQTLTECARHCGQMSILSFTLVFPMLLFLLVTREMFDFVCFQILQVYYLMVQSFDAVLLNDMQTRWLAPDHIFLKRHIRLEMSRLIRTCAWRYTLPSCFQMFSCLSL